MLKTCILTFVALGITVQAGAQEISGPEQLTTEAEFASVLTSGNTETETYKTKILAGYRRDLNVFKLEGSYLVNRVSGTESARIWDAGARWERILSDRFNSYLGYKSEANIYGGLIQRNSTDVGGKYYLIKSHDTNLFSELGYRYAVEQQYTKGLVISHYGRVYLEGIVEYAPYLTGRMWIEYLPNFTSSEDYQVNMEPSLSFVLSQVFSLRMGFLGKYDNVPGKPDAKRLDGIYTTALVARF